MQIFVLLLNNHGCEYQTLAYGWPSLSLSPVQIYWLRSGHGHGQCVDLTVNEGELWDKAGEMDR